MRSRDHRLKALKLCTGINLSSFEVAFLGCLSQQLKADGEKNSLKCPFPREGTANSLAEKTVVFAEKHGGEPLRASQSPFPQAKECEK